MELNYDIFVFVKSLVVIQGVTLGSLLILINKKNHKSSFYLGLMLVLLSSQHLNPIVEDSGLIEYYPFLYRLPVNFIWLLAPLFYIYSQDVSLFGNKKIKFWLLYPGIFASFLQLALFFLPYEVKVLVVGSFWYKIFFLSGLLYSNGVIFYNIKLISKHKNRTKNIFSMLESKELKWAKVFLIFVLVGTNIYLLQYYLLPKNNYSRIFYMAFDLVAIYWLSYHGIQQRNVLSLLSEPSILKLNLNHNKTVQNLPLQPSDNKVQIMDRINQYMRDSESFMNPELTIIDLSKKLNMHPRGISSAINSVSNKNFNTYINELRVKKAEIFLRNNKLENLTIEGIGHEVGFHSKSAFYAAFKKTTGTTPTSYKEKYAA